MNAFIGDEVGCGGGDMLSTVRLRENISSSSTRRVTVGVLTGVLIAIIGVVLNIVVISQSTAGEPVSSELGAGAPGVVAAGAVLTVMSSIALARRRASRHEDEGRRSRRLFDSVELRPPTGEAL